ncbi:unnamed protein product [Protopolystoma xenopodis]|uniref:Lon proteolytic domain-containing protein n=1 Tax=Protopolystoma xenopodis TaxID=117903 RepID=A0A448WYL5_9PLAT|nr:unnamed protein product [Protopolystoma xenopodis]
MVLRKAAYKLINAEVSAPIVIDETNLRDYVGQPMWTSDRLYSTTTPPGIAMGLAWTAMGGSILYIECTNRSPRFSSTNSKTSDSDKKPEDSHKITG